MRHYPSSTMIEICGNKNIFKKQLLIEKYKSIKCVKLSTIEIEDIEYFQRKLLASLRIPSRFILR